MSVYMCKCCVGVHIILCKSQRVGGALSDSMVSKVKVATHRGYLRGVVLVEEMTPAHSLLHMTQTWQVNTEIRTFLYIVCYEQKTRPDTNARMHEVSSSRNPFSLKQNKTKQQ